MLSSSNPNRCVAVPRPNTSARSGNLAAAMGQSANSMSISSVQNAMRMAVASCGLKKQATCHTLRHSFATHLLEGGVSIGQVSAYLGHASIYSTLIYLHVSGDRDGARGTAGALPPLLKCLYKVMQGSLTCCPPFLMPGKKQEKLGG